jgi:hypothetical protein
MNERLNCEAARLQASAWIDAELQDERALHEHLNGCAACRAHAQALREAQALFEPLRNEEPVADLWPQIQARANSLTARKTQAQTPRAHWARAAAALLGCAGTAALLHAASRAAESRDAPDIAHLSELLHGQMHRPALEALPEQRLLAAIENARAAPSTSTNR